VQVAISNSISLHAFNLACFRWLVAVLHFFYNNDFWIVLVFNWRNELAYVFEVCISSLFDNVSVEIAF